MVNPNMHQEQTHKILDRVSSTTNDPNDPNYFKDYYVERRVKVRTAKREGR